MRQRRKSKKRHLLLDGILSIDITASEFNPIRRRDSNIVVSWENVGRYFKVGFSKALRENIDTNKELVP